jgi:glycosyltransferase involved in cell wall biosynthesis
VRHAGEHPIPKVGIAAQGNEKDIGCCGRPRCSSAVLYRRGIDVDFFNPAKRSGSFVFPSTTDTFGNVVLEAQASGLPVIVTDEGGPSENLVHRETGLVVPADDRQALLEAMRSLVDDPLTH